MSTITSDCHRLSDFFIVAAFGAGFAMKVSSLNRLTVLHHKEHKGHEEFLIYEFFPSCKFCPSW
jgi:hypothetical protein